MKKYSTRSGGLVAQEKEEENFYWSGEMGKNSASHKVSDLSSWFSP